MVIILHCRPIGQESGAVTQQAHLSPGSRERPEFHLLESPCWAGTLPIRTTRRSAAALAADCQATSSQLFS